MNHQMTRQELLRTATERLNRADIRCRRTFSTLNTMSFCPNCGVPVAQTSTECSACGALFSADAWSPVSTPPIREPDSWLYLFGRVLVWGGHFFLIAVPVLFVLYHLFLYSGGGTSGVPLAMSIMFSPVLYIPGFILCALGRHRA